MADGEPAGAQAANSGDAASPQRGEFVQAFDRGLAVILAFDAEHPRLTLSEVARRAGATRAAARRLLHTLVQLGYVRTEGRYFSLRPKVLELGYAYLSALSLPEIAKPYLEELASTVHESAYMSVLDGSEIVCVAEAPMRRIWTIMIGVGTRFPALVTAAGRVMLAWQNEEWLDGFLASAEIARVTPYTTVDRAQLNAKLAAVRENGWALVDHELQEGLRTVAVPVRSGDALVAAISFSTIITGESASLPESQLLPPLLAAARAVEADLAVTRKVEALP